jgi:starch synthase
VKVLFLAVEAAPLAKVGGLGDVAGELPVALRALGVDVLLALPRHAGLSDKSIELGDAVEIEVKRRRGSRSVKVRRARYGRKRLLLVEGPSFANNLSIYTETGFDAERYTLFSLAALEACEAFGWTPDVVHANDWHTAPALAWLHAQRGSKPIWTDAARILTIHNLPYLGEGGQNGIKEYGIPTLNDRSMPSWARSLPLPVGMAAAHRITTVSPTYAREIQTPAFGCGLERWLGDHADLLVGILNGIDPEIWDPEQDDALVQNYSREDLAARAKNKPALQREIGLPEDPGKPLLGIVSRLAFQKGVDLALAALSGLLGRDWQLVVLGTGDPALEQRAREFEGVHHDRVRVSLRFDPLLARRFYAGCDMMLIPSRYEPCGLTQMIAMRYGCVPVVRRTGGLADTVEEYVTGGKGVGFTFGPPQAKALRTTLRGALKVYRDQRRWKGIQRRGMAKDFSWERAAQGYTDLYRRTLEELGQA